MPGRRTSRISIVGAGAVGSSLGRALHGAGYPVVSVVSRSGSAAISLARGVGCKRASTQIEDLAADTECLLLTVPDEVITSVASRIAKLKRLTFKKLFAVHCSGVHSAEILEPIRRKGALVASMHPIQTFPAGRRTALRAAELRGITYGIEGEQDALKRAERLVADLGGRTLIVRRELKALYHVMCVFASNYLMVQLNAIDELTKKLGAAERWEAIFGPLMTATMENAVALSPSDALTGPIIRGDFSTVDLHLAALSTYAPHFLPLYISGGVEVARVGRERGSISQEEFEKVVGQFRQFLKGRSFTNTGKAQR